MTMHPLVIDLGDGVVAIVLAAFGGVGWLVRWWAGRQPPRIDPAAQQAAYDKRVELLEARHDKEMGVMQDKLDESEARTTACGQQVRLRDDYVQTLRRQLSDADIKPAEYPSSLL